MVLVKGTEKSSEMVEMATAVSGGKTQGEGHQSRNAGGLQPRKRIFPCSLQIDSCPHLSFSPVKLFQNFYL